jgi:hypothetical protein
MVINVDPNVVYAILIAIVVIVLIVQTPRIIQSQTKNSSEALLEETEQTTQQWQS